MLDPDITPNIWKLAEDSRVFNQHYSASNCTRFGIFSLFYGLYGTYWHSFLAEQQGPVFVREMKKRGYEMGVFASAPLINPEFDRTVFADVRDGIELKQDGTTALERDVQITRKMVHFVEERNSNNPFFGFLFYDTPHSKQFPKNFGIYKPYIESVNYMALDRKQNPQPIINNYKNSLRFVDSSVGEVITALKNKGRLKDTAIIITGDHGEEFNDLKLGYWGHNGNFARYQTRTPLVLHIPGTAARRHEHTTSSLDVVPTLMKELFGCITEPTRFSNGTYLTDTRQRSFIHVSTWDSFALVDNRRICVIENKGGTEIVDCNYRELPGEKIDPLLSKEAMEGMSRFYGQPK
jgi:membrane-anchored protein YejM (alkaline phosphatase superfamily)